MKPFYCAFFSYKGGVGRTSALMNVAIYLAKRKKRVLIMDLDLHAPGVDIFDVTNEDLVKRLPSYHPVKLKKIHDFYKKNLYDTAIIKEALKAGFSNEYVRIDHNDYKNAPKGFVELCIEWQKSLTKKPSNPKLPSIKYPEELYNNSGDQYLYRLPEHNKGDGDIIVMRAGNHDDHTQYEEDLKKLDIKLLDPGYDLQFSDRTLQYTDETRQNNSLGDTLDQKEKDSNSDKKKDSNEKIVYNGMPRFISTLKDQIEQNIEPHYVLVDCRPGTDWISNLALTWFSECVVLAFNFNPWNIQGIINVYQQVKKTPYQREHPNILLVASPIPRYARTSTLYSNQNELIKQKMGDARNCGKGSEGLVEVPYADILALRDVLISDIQENDPAVFSYSRLGHLIINGNQQDLEIQIQNALSYETPEKVISAFENILRDKSAGVEVLYEYGKYLLSLKRLGSAEKKIEKAWNLINSLKDKPHMAYYKDTLYYRSRVFIEIAKDFLFTELKKKNNRFNKTKNIQIDSHINKLKEVENRIKQDFGYREFDFPEMHALLADIYIILSELLQTKIDSSSDEKIIDYYKFSVKQYQIATDNSPSVAEYKHGLGYAQAQFALWSAEGKEGLEKAIKTFEETIRINSDSPDTYLQLGRNHLALSVILKNETNRKNESLLPLFLNHIPYTNLKWIDEWKEIEAITINDDQLKQAERRFTEHIRLRSNEFFGYFNRGITRTLLGINDFNKKKEENKQFNKNIFDQAIMDFQKSSLYGPLFSPAYLYSGATQFILDYLDSYVSKSDSGSSLLRSIRHRQAFYNLEHFIDQEIERLLDCDIDNRKPFYFDPSDIDEILEKPFNFLLTIENQLKLPPVIKLILYEINDHLDFSPRLNKKYMELMNAHI